MGIILKKWRGIAMEKKINDYFEEICKTQTVYSYGDKYLYRMSKDALENIETKKIASMIWLIGRSYAASPERIKGIKNEENYKPDIIFEKLANKMVEILESTKDKLDKEYNYDCSKEDIDLLKESIQIVININSCRFLNDSNILNEKNDVNNMISFSSKILHFCLPKTVFIIDQYSRIGTKRLFDLIRNKTKEINVNDELKIKIENLRVFDKKKYSDIVDKLKVKLGIEDVKKNEAIIEYIKHVSGCYVIAKYCKENGFSGIKIDDDNESICSTPRLVDSILLNIGEAKEKSDK